MLIFKGKKLYILKKLYIEFVVWNWLNINEKFNLDYINKKICL